jgi:hypothetical protein
MWRAIGFPVLLAALITLFGVVPGGGASPRFTLSEEVIIARNDALTALLPLDPAGVRTILDALAAARRSQEGVRPEPPKETYRDVLGGPGGERIRIDSARNPDLDQLFRRASPEAAYDLFQILKRVGTGKAGIN